MQDFVHNKCTPVENGFAICVPDVMGRFTTDVIGAVAFGMETDALTNMDSFFFKMAKRSVVMSKMRLFKFGLFSFFPKIGNFFKMQAMDKDLSDFFLGILRKAFLEREQNRNEGREDFLQILIEAKAENKTNIDFTVDLAVQQAFLFFIAG
jgi:cytochrome P450 family 6